MDSNLVYILDCWSEYVTVASWLRDLYLQSRKRYQTSFAKWWMIVTLCRCKNIYIDEMIIDIWYFKHLIASACITVTYGVICCWINCVPLTSSFPTYSKALNLKTTTNNSYTTHLNDREVIDGPSICHKLQLWSWIYVLYDFITSFPRVWFISVCIIAYIYIVREQSW